MPGLGNPTDTAITPGRKTVLTLDAKFAGVQEPPFWHEWNLDEISFPSGLLANNVRYLPKIGWRLKTYQWTTRVVHEAGTADDSVISFLTPLQVSTKKKQRANTDLTGVPLGSQRSSGDDFYVKNVAAGDSWNVGLTSDQTAFPGPDNSGDYVPVDRLAISPDLHYPDEGLALRFSTPSMASGKSVSALMRLYFTGPAGSVSGEASGTGAYSLTLGGDGIAELHERLANATWKLRMQFSWAGRHEVMGHHHIILIDSDAKQIEGQWKGSKIAFVCENSTGALDVTVRAGIAVLGGRDIVYEVPQSLPVAPTVQPARADIRRDIRAEFQVSRAKYYASGTLRTYNFSFQVPPTVGDTFQVQIYGFWPIGTGINIQVFDAKTNAELVGDTIAGFTEMAYRNFTIASQNRAYNIVVTFDASADGRKSPTWDRVRVIKNTKKRLMEPTAVVPRIVESVSLTGPDSDPSHESARFVCHDLPGDLDVLRLRAGMPIQHEVRYDSGDPTLTSVLFKGYVAQAKGRKRGTGRGYGLGSQSAPKPYPAADWRTYSIRAAGEWQRLWEQLAPQTYNFGEDETLLSTGGGRQPWKVTSIIRTLLSGAGYPDHMIDVPDYPTRFFPENGEALVIEPYSQLGPIIIQFARDYLGAFLVFDPNATNDPDAVGWAAYKLGCWRLIIPPRPPFINLAEFLYAPNSAAMTMGLSLAAQVDGDGGDGQVMKRTWIRSRSFSDYVVPPEANLIMVTGVGAGPKGFLASVNSEAQRLTQIAINYKSAWFNEDQEVIPDENDPDYLGRVVPLYYSDPGLQTPEAVNFVCRRIYDMAAHGQKRLQFEAPLVLVTDQSDTMQVRPRPLRFGDPVLFEGEQFIIASCNVDYSAQLSGDRRQMAAYELFSVPYLQNYAVAAGRTE